MKLTLSKFSTFILLLSMALAAPARAGTLDGGNGPLLGPCDGDHEARKRQTAPIPGGSGEKCIPQTPDAGELITNGAAMDNEKQD